jgi:O-antigen ligase
MDFFYKEKVIGVLKRMLFIHNPYDYSYIFKSTFKISEGILLFFLITNFIKKEKVLSRIHFLLILGWGIAIFLGFIQYFGGILGNERWPMRMFSMFDNPNLFGGYLILIFPFSILYAIDKPFFKRISFSILAMDSIVALILSRSKNSWIAFTILLILIGIYFLISFLKRREYKSSINILNWRWIGALMITFVIIFGSFYFYLSRGPILGLLAEDVNWQVSIEQKLGLRLPLWKYALQIVEDFPLWGVGIGEFNFIFQKYSSGHFVPDLESYQTHNYFLQIGVELGLIGLYAFLWTLGRIINKGFQMMKTGQDLRRLGLWFGIIGFIFTFFMDGYLWNIEMQLMFWLMIGLLFVDGERNEIGQIHRKSFDKNLLMGLSIIIFLTIPFQIYQKLQIFYPPDKTLGLYKEIFEEEGKEYRWGEKVVLIPLEIMGKSVNIPIKLGNPDIREKAVRVKIFINRKMVDILDFRDNDWHILRYSIEDTKSTEISLKIEASRTWNPYLTDGRLYPWDLGPAIGKIYWS